MRFLWMDRRVTAIPIPVHSRPTGIPVRVDLMTENQTPQPPPPTQVEPVVITPAPKTPFKDRVLGMRAVAGVAAASLILGGAGGAALGVIGSGSDDRTAFRGGPGGMFGGPNGLPPGMNGQQLSPPGMNGQQGQPGSP
jgi:hypothetical protein